MDGGLDLVLPSRVNSPDISSCCLWLIFVDLHYYMGGLRPSVAPRICYPDRFRRGIAFPNKPWHRHLPLLLRCRVGSRGGEEEGDIPPPEDSASAASDDMIASKQRGILSLLCQTNGTTTHLLLLFSTMENSVGTVREVGLLSLQGAELTAHYQNAAPLPPPDHDDLDSITFQW